MADFKTKVWAGERIYLVDFGRAKTGDPHMKFPEVDNIGFQDDANPGEHGHITSIMVGLGDVRVKVFRTEIANSARLYIVSNNNRVISVTDPPDGVLQPTREQVIRFDAPEAGRAALEVRYNWPDGPVIGRLYVQVYQKQKIPVRLHLVTVNNAGNPANFFGKLCRSRDEKVERLKWFIRQVNHTWIPHGIMMTPEANVYDTAWTNAHIGSNSVSPNSNELKMGGALSPNRSAASVNVYVLGTWNMGSIMALGIPVAWAKQQNLLYPVAPAGPAAAPGPGAAPVVQHLANALYLRSDTAVAPVIVAHEFGHYLELCKLVNTGAGIGTVQQWHSTGDSAGGAPGARDDLVSRRRMMYPIITLMGPSFPWRNDTGYGVGKTGALVTYRRLTQDITMEESRRARDASSGPNLFAV